MRSPKVHNFVLPLQLPATAGWIGFEGSSLNPGDPVVFPFKLCGKVAQLAHLQIPQFWIKRSDLLPRGKRISPMFRSVIDYWWARYWADGGAMTPAMQDLYLLANLLPFVRDHGSRDVVDDSVATREPDEGSVADLEETLAASRGKRLSALKFREATAQSIGPEVVPASTAALYSEITSDLLVPGRQALAERGKAGLQPVIATWKHWKKRFGKHGRSAEHRRVLDMLSYESRAAFFQCYDAVWRALLQEINHRMALSSEAARFHMLWHSLVRGPSKDSDTDDFFLFRAMPYALHPAAGLFIRTPTGQTLIAARLQDPNSQAAKEKFWHGMAMAVDHYSRVHGDVKQERKVAGEQKRLKRDFRPVRPSSRVRKKKSD